MPDPQLSDKWFALFQNGRLCDITDNKKEAEEGTEKVGCQGGYLPNYSYSSFSTIIELKALIASEFLKP